MSTQEQDLAIYNVAQEIAQEQGLELVEVKVNRHRNDVAIQILVDTPQGNIGIEACSSFNRSIVEAIDKKGILSEDGYSLEASSPGLDRPLTTERDFLRNLNYEVRLLLKERVENKMEHTGVIKAVSDGKLTILSTKEQKEITVPLNTLMKGLLVI